MYNVTDFADYKFNEVSKLDTLVSFAMTPPSIDNISENQKAKLKVFVPKGTLARYQAADVWKEFWNMKEYDAESSGINAVDSNEDIQVKQSADAITVLGLKDGERVSLYDLSGKEIVSAKATNGVAVFKKNMTDKIVVVRTNSEAMKVRL